MTNGYNPGSRFSLGSRYGKRIDPITGVPGEFHSGLDFAARAGTPIPAASSGKVVYSGYNKGLGNVVIVKNDVGDYSLYGHMLDASQFGLGQRIWQGDTIGLVGSTGLRSKGNHLHYSVIPAAAGLPIEQVPRNGGPIGIRLNEGNTTNPVGYDNYDSTPRHLDASRRAAQVISGEASDVTPGGLPSARSTSFADRFGGWTSPADEIVAHGLDPRSLLPQAGAASGVPGGAPERFLRSYIAGKPANSVFETGAPAVLEFPPNDLLPDHSASLDDRFGSWPYSPGGDVSPRNPNLPLPPSETDRPLGIVSGQPMPQWITPPPIFGPRDRSKAPVDEGSEWLMRMIRSIGDY